VAAPDTIAGIALGDVLDLSALLTGYTKFKEADATDTGAGFVEIRNQVLTQTGGKTFVKFDVFFDAASFTSQKINGATIDLKYQYSAITGSDVASVTFTNPNSGSPIDAWENITYNLEGSSGNGKIVMTAKGISSSTTTILDANPRITADSTGNGKAIGVTLVINSLVDSFAVGFDSATDGGLNSLTLANGTSATPTLGISKTARLAGTSAATVTTGTLELINDTTTLGVVGDNQIRSVSTLSTDGKSGTFKFQYDTNAAAGTTSLSDVVAINLISADSLATFLNGANTFKVI